MKNEPFVITNLRDIYHKQGEFEYKLILNMDMFDQNINPQLLVLDSSGHPLKSQVKVWGSKLRCIFTIDESVSDGAALSVLILNSKDGIEHKKTVSFWIIK